MWDTLQRIAAAQGITPQQAFTAALREYLARHLPSLPDEAGATPPASLAPRAVFHGFAKRGERSPWPEPGSGHGDPRPLPHAPA